MTITRIIIVLAILAVAGYGYYLYKKSKSTEPKPDSPLKNNPEVPKVDEKDWIKPEKEKEPVDKEPKGKNKK